MKRTVAAAALCLAIASCGGDTSGPVGSDVIDRQTFVDTYVDLRLAAIESPDFRIPAESREEILTRHGVDAEDLLRFADVYGRDLELMNEVWTEIEARFQESSGDATPSN